jgi:hypothetical protein
MSSSFSASRYGASFVLKYLIPKLSDFLKDVIFLSELAYFQAKIACSNLGLKNEEQLNF